MHHPRLAVLVDSEDDGTWVVRSPKLGRWSDPPPGGALLGAGSVVGRLAQLHRRYSLVMPDGVSGRVIEEGAGAREVAVEFGQALFRLAPLAQSACAAEAAQDSEAGPAPESEECAVVSPTDGVFYRCPSPGEPPFVEAGSRVQRGQPVGLVEVMKTFNQIVYDGPGLPESAEVVEVRCPDAGEVHAGDVLIVVRPA